MKRPLLVAAGLIALSSVAGGCYPNRVDGTNYDAVATLYDTTANFQAATFAVDDSVVHLVPPGQIDNITHAFDAAIIAEVRAQMTGRGYTEVATPTTADIDVLVAVSTTDYQGYYWDYWCGYWGYWYPYGCGGGYYYEYTVGSLFVGLTDRRAVSAGKVPTIWLGIANGLAGTGATAQRLVNGVEQMFLQSPYITAN